MITLFGLNACSIQKRKHLNGLHIEWLSSKNEKPKIKKPKVETNSLNQIKFLNNKIFDANLNGEIIIINEKKYNIESNQIFTEKNTASKNELEFKQSKQKSLNLKTKKRLIHNDEKRNKQQANWAMLALIFGVCSLTIFPLFGLLGLHFAEKVTDPEHKGVAKIGKILSIIGLAILILAFYF